MTRAQLEERIQKATEKITKKEGTIVKKTNLIAKKLEQASKMTDERERRWMESDAEWLQDDIDRLRKEIPEIKKTIEKYEKQLAGEIEKEDLFTREMPKEFLQLQKDLVDSWDETDLYRKNFYKEKYEEIRQTELHPFNAFCRKYSYASYQHMHMSEEEFHKQNMKDSEILIVNLYNRIKEITGEVTSWAGIHTSAGNNGFPVLTGIVDGKCGRASVETILAGGYNIQKLHIRTLVHSI